MQLHQDISLSDKPIMLWIAGASAYQSMATFLQYLEIHRITYLKTLKKIGSGAEAEIYEIPDTAPLLVLRSEILQKNGKHKKLIEFSKKTMSDDAKNLGVIKLFCIFQMNSRIFSVMPRYSFHLRDAMPAVHQLAAYDNPFVSVDSIFLKILSAVFFSSVAALAAFKNAGMTHHDVKPENIGIGPEPFDVSLADYGLLDKDRAIDDDEFQFGTCAYLPLDSSWKGVASDSWSVGFILLEMMRLVVPSKGLGISAEDSRQRIESLFCEAKLSTVDLLLTELKMFQQESGLLDSDSFVLDAVKKIALLMTQYDVHLRPSVSQLQEVANVIRPFVSTATSEEFANFCKIVENYQRSESSMSARFSDLVSSGFSPQPSTVFREEASPGIPEVVSPIPK